VSDLALTSAGSLGARDPQARLRQAAKAFEAHFLAQILKSTEKPMFDEEPLVGGGAGSSTFKSMLNQALSENAAGGLGIAEMIERQLTRG
jgi:Rod binding domain-containing protein